MTLVRNPHAGTDRYRGSIDGERVLRHLDDRLRIALGHVDVGRIGSTTSSQSRRRRSRRACAPADMAWSARAGGARSGSGRQRAPAGASGQRIARAAPEVVTPEALRPGSEPQSLHVPPTCMCQPLRGHVLLATPRLLPPRQPPYGTLRTCRSPPSADGRERVFPEVAAS